MPPLVVPLMPRSSPMQCRDAVSGTVVLAVDHVKQGLDHALLVCF